MGFRRRLPSVFIAVSCLQARICAWLAVSPPTPAGRSTLMARLSTCEYPLPGRGLVLRHNVVLNAVVPRPAGSRRQSQKEYSVSLRGHSDGLAAIAVGSAQAIKRAARRA